jgi:CO/xanthine dehydrogenase Mo-binding subunit
VRDRMTVHASIQAPYYVHLMLAQILDTDISRIRVIKPHVGGGLGCRIETLNVELKKYGVKQARRCYRSFIRSRKRCFWLIASW